MSTPSTVIEGNDTTVEFDATNDWGTGFVGSVEITNSSGAALNGWMLTFNLAENITNIWNAIIVSHIGTEYVIANASWNASVANGATVSFGFQTDGGNPVLPTTYVLNGVSSAAPPPPTLSIADSSVTETPTGATENFTVTLSAAFSTPVTVAYTTADGTAHAGADYTATSGTLTFAPGTTTETISVATRPGGSATETYSVDLSNPSGAVLARAQATGTINNPAPAGSAPAWSATAIYAAGMTVAENGVLYRANWWTQGNSPASNNGVTGTGEPWTAIGTVAPPNPSVPNAPTGLAATGTTTTATTLSWSAATVPNGGTVTEYAVFENGKQIATTTATTDTVTGLNAGTAYSFTVEAIDAAGNSAQSTAVAVTTQEAASVPNAPTGLVATGTTTTATTLSWSAATVPNGGTVTGYAVLENGKQIATTTATTDTVTGLNAGTAYSFTVEAIDAAGNSAQSTAVAVTTAETSTQPSVSIADASVTEAAGGVTETFTVTLSAASSTPITVAFATADGSAHAGTDYTATSGTLTFAPGTTSETISVPTQFGLSPTETYTVDLSNPSGATLARAQATGTIINPEAGTPPAWSSTAIYTQGMTASENDIVYQANYWTQGNDPATSNGVPTTGDPWTEIGLVTPTTSVPNALTGLAAAYTSPSAVTLAWNAATVPGGGTVTGYAIYENGAQVATTTATTDTVTGLTPSSTYSFTVAALDSLGASPQGTALAVTTPAVPPPGSPTDTFAPYIDMGLPADANLLAIAQATGITTFTLAFIQSSGPDTIGWTGLGTISDDTLSNGTTMLSQIQQLQAAGDNIIISFGGEAGTDPAAVATSAAQLQAEYQSVIDRYGVTSLDFDIEGAVEGDQASLHMRDEALIGLKAANPGLTISFTLPVLPTGLDYNGLNIIRTAKNDGLNPDVINIMTMDYGSTVDNNGQMGLDAIQAVQATEKQIAAVGLTSKIGVIPDIGVNDVTSEVFTLADAQQLLAYAQTDPDVVRLSMWAVNRDNGTGAGQTYSTDTSSGLAQAPYAFSQVFERF